MARKVTLLYMREQVRLRTDKVGSGAVTDDEINSYLNSSISELYDLLVSAYGNDYFFKEFTIQTISGKKDYPLPADFYKLLGVDLLVSQNHTVRLKRRDFSDRISGNLGIHENSYRISGDNIIFSCEPSLSTSVIVSYIPISKILQLDQDEFDGINGWEEFAIIDTAIKVLQKEESETAEFRLQKANIIQRISAMSENRDAGEPFVVSDTTGGSHHYQNGNYLYMGY